MVRLKKIATGTTGSEIAEAALVLPIFFLIMLGIYWFGRAFNTYATINHAAREGARVGRGADLRHLWQPQHLADHESDCHPSQAVPPGFQPRSHSGHKISAEARTACGGLGTTSCQVPSSGPQICVYYNVQLPNTLPAGSGAPACGVSVQFQYPYQFALPYTSLNMQKIMLNAGVQMTGEY